MERAIGCVRVCDYTILNGLVPVSMVLPCQDEDMAFLDKIVTVCFAWTNMCPSVVMKPCYGIKLELYCKYFLYTLMHVFIYKYTNNTQTITFILNAIR